MVDCIAVETHSADPHHSCQPRLPKQDSALYIPPLTSSNGAWLDYESSYTEEGDLYWEIGQAVRQMGRGAGSLLRFLPDGWLMDGGRGRFVGGSEVDAGTLIR